MQDLWLALRLLLLLTVANTAPIMAKHWLGERWAWPLDGGRVLRDGRRLLGPSKTWRGLVVAVLCAAAAAPLLGLPAWAGALAGLAAMAGDALSSFVKRRLGIATSGPAFGLDQLAEVLLPLLALQPLLAWPWRVVAGVTLAFVLLEVPAARLWHRLGLRDRPY